MVSIRVTVLALLAIGMIASFEQVSALKCYKCDSKLDAACADEPKKVTTVECKKEEETTVKPTEATTKPTEATTKPTEATTKPTEATTKPTEATTKPTEATTKPTEATTKPTEATTKPTEATTKPTEATTKPTEATTKPTEATTKPTEATTKPTEATTKPTEATTKPTEATTKPTEATTKPTEATTKPTEATTKPTEATTKPTEATTKPTEATTKPTEATTKSTTTVEPDQPNIPDETDINFGIPFVESLPKRFRRNAVSRAETEFECYKLVFKEGDKEVTQRGCQEKALGCDKLKEGKTGAECNVCSDNECNSSSGLTLGVMSVLIPVSIVALFAR